MRNYKQKKWLVFTIILIVLNSILIPNISGNLLSNYQYETKAIGIKDAIKVAKSQISLLEKQEYLISDITEIQGNVKFPLMYVCFLNPKGYIVVPALRDLPPVIAYSFTNEFGKITQSNILLQLLKADISIRLDHICKIPDYILNNRYTLWQHYLTESKVKLQRLSKNTVGPLLETQWHQNSPYNNFCPIDLSSGKRSVAGCPAVAMAQILNYHRTTQNIEFDDNDDYYHNYLGNKYWIDNDYEVYDFPSFPELNSYLLTLEDHYENEIPLTDDDKAAINFACGVAATQVYHPGGSGTFGVNQAYQAYQRFSFEEVELLDENNPDLYDRLQANILDGRPVHIAVVNEEWTVGHNMVVDGYNDDGYYHINFGWGGTYDGWYMLPEELPYELTVIEGIIVDILPDYLNSKLDGNGVLTWSDVKPGSTVTGFFTIQNIGDPESSIDWEIISYPSWGTWIFTQESGEDLKPEDGELIIEVTVTAPEKKNEEFAGYVKVVNIDDSSDYCLIHASLITPRFKQIYFQVLRFLEDYLYLFSLLQHILGIRN